MLLFTARKLSVLVMTLLVSSFLIFGSLYLAPGDPVTYLAHGKATPAQLAALRQEFHLNDPFWQRYGDWLIGALHGDLGLSLQYKENAATLVGDRLPVTGLLVAYSALLIIVVGLLVGLTGALRRGIVDRVLLAATSAATATPAFVSAVILLAVFSVKLDWFPAVGAGDGFVDELWHLTLPAIALAFSLVGLVARIARSAFIDNLRREHVDVARSRGIPEHVVVRRHVVRNSLGPIATVTGLVVASLLVGTTLVETAFGISGVGSLLASSVQTLDFPVVQAIGLLVITAFLVCNTIVDLLYPVIDPRLATWRGRS